MRIRWTVGIVPDEYKQEIEEEEAKYGKFLHIPIKVSASRLTSLRFVRLLLLRSMPVLLWQVSKRLLGVFSVLTAYLICMLCNRSEEFQCACVIISACAG